jgi:environmental stress-induced protein Ves
VTARWQCLRHAAYVPMPWKNGAGTTLEIARSPPAPGEFDWRLSLATIASSGPFSAYPGYERMVALAAGSGFALQVGAATATALRAPGDSLLFAGEAATQCRLAAGVCTDLSLMVRRPGAVLGVERLEPADQPVTIELSAPLQALLCLAGGAAVGVAGDAAPAELGRFDTLLMPGPSGALVARRLGADPAVLLLARWRPAGDVRQTSTCAASPSA